MKDMRYRIGIHAIIPSREDEDSAIECTADCIDREELERRGPVDRKRCSPVDGSIRAEVAGRIVEVRNTAAIMARMARIAARFINLRIEGIGALLEIDRVCTYLFGPTGTGFSRLLRMNWPTRGGDRP